MKKTLLRFILFGALLGVAVFSYNAFNFYQKIYASNLQINQPEVNLYIGSKDKLSDVFQKLNDSAWLKAPNTFLWVANKMNYGNKIYPGRYILRQDMNNKELITLLRGGLQTPVKVTFNNIQSSTQLAGVISKQIEADSADLMQLFSNPSSFSTLRMNKYTSLSAFIPNTYEFYWNTSAESFFNKMLKEYEKFWSKELRTKAREIPLTPTQVSTLASIIEEESQKPEELPIIAGLYINRLKQGYKLQADPTVRYVVNDTITRVLNKHLKIESPYNTYLHYGLPPGPIRLPSITSIRAVLNYKKHGYLYMCAKEDFSGYHNFARTLSEHNHNARLYQAALNERRIYR